MSSYIPRRRTQPVAGADALEAAASKISECIEQLTKNADSLVAGRHEANAGRGTDPRGDAVVFDIKLLSSRLGDYVTELVTMAKDAQRRAAAAMVELRELATKNVALEASLSRSASTGGPTFASLKTLSSNTPIDSDRPCHAPSSDCECDQQHGECAHKKQLASHIIDRTFDDHRRVLRGRLTALEKEVEELRSGASITLLRDELKKKQRELEERDAALAAANEKWVNAQARLMASRTAPPAADPPWISGAKPEGGSNGGSGSVAQLQTQMAFGEILFLRCTMYPFLHAELMVQWCSQQHAAFTDAMVAAALTPRTAPTLALPATVTPRNGGDVDTAPRHHNPFHRTGGGFHATPSPRGDASARRRKESLRLSSESEGVLGSVSRGPIKGAGRLQ